MGGGAGPRGGPPRLLRYEDEQIYNAVRHQPSRVRLVGGSA
jgi:hypothetical protein